MRLKRYSFLLIIASLLFSNILIAQQYTWPESVVYDSVNDRYLISNTGSGDIIAVPRNDPTNMSLFVLGTNSGWVSMKGIIIIGNTIWCACTYDASIGFKEALIGRDLNTGAITNTIDFPNADFINDVTHDPSTGIIYLSDNSHIYRVDPSDGTYSTIVPTIAYSYNGVYFDAANNRLLYTDDSPAGGAQISVFDPSDNSTSVLFESPAGIQYCDGLTMDHLGNIYYSVWSNPNQVMRYNPNTGIVDVASTGHNGIAHSGAADIYYHDLSGLPKTNDAMSSVGTLVVPNFGPDPNNVAPFWGWVDFIPFDQLESEYEESIPTNISLKQNFPNPFNPNTSISYDINKENSVKLTVYDLLGSEIVTLVNRVEQPGAKVVQWDGRNQKGEIVNGGVYLYKLEIGNYIETKKMVLLK